VYKFVGHFCLAINQTEGKSKMEGNQSHDAKITKRKKEKFLFKNLVKSKVKQRNNDEELRNLHSFTSISRWHGGKSTNQQHATSKKQTLESFKVRTDRQRDTRSSYSPRLRDAAGRTSAPGSAGWVELAERRLGTAAVESFADRFRDCWLRIWGRLEARLDWLAAVTVGSGLVAVETVT
jgi:hypothetical protein